MPLFRDDPLHCHLPLAGKALAVEPEVRGPAADPFPGLGAFVHHVVGDKLAEGVPVPGRCRSPVGDDHVMGGGHCGSVASGFQSAGSAAAEARLASAACGTAACCGAAASCGAVAAAREAARRGTSSVMTTAAPTRMAFTDMATTIAVTYAGVDGAGPSAL